MNPFRSVGGKLAFALVLFLAGALGAVYFFVVPNLEARQIDERLDQLEAAAALISTIPDDPFLWGDWAQFQLAPTANARAVVYDRLTPRSLQLVADSEFDSDEIVTDPVALRSLATGTTERGVAERDGERFAEVAFAITPDGPFVLLSASLEDSLAVVDSVARRLLVTGGLALAAGLALGLIAARLFTRRIRRLEQAAERIAGGSFDEPVVDPTRDELGELATAFEQMRQRLAHLDRARREFIANASHELRTPVFSLGGFLELLADEDLDEQTRREFTQTAQEQVARLGKLATDLLDLSRLDAGRLQVERTAVDLADLAGALAHEFRAVAAAADHELEAWATGDVPALGDEQRVFQIGRILVENALVHTPPGTRVRLHAAARNGSAVLTVEDDGPGIEADQAPHVFDRFYRGDGTQASGSGLGLAIARELAELMGGTVQHELANGRTRFTLALPRAG